VPHVRPATLVVPAAALALFALGAAIVWSDLTPDEANTLAPLFTAPRIGLVLFFALALAAAVGVLTHRLLAPMRIAARRIDEAVRLTTHGNPAHRIALTAPPELAAVAGAVNALADARSQLQSDVDRAVAAAKAGVEEERTRLAALISELDQSVLVCNRDGRVLLYNAAAKALIGGADASGGGDLVGLGRSVHGILERPVVLHAIESLEREVARDSRQSTQFVTATRDGRLLRVRAAPVVGAPTRASSSRELTGFVLLLSDITDTVDADSRRVARFQSLIEATRAALANIRAAIENLTEHPDLDAARRLRFATVIRDEAVALSERVNIEAAERVEARWPLEDMRGEDLLTLARSRIERRTALSTKLDQVDATLWLHVDSFSLAQGLCYVARRLDEEFAVRELRFRLSASAGHAQLDAVWRGPPLSSETAFAWQSEPFSAGGEESSLTLVQVIERHGGESWYQRDVPSQTAYFRFLLPLAESRAERRVQPEGRPEFYDFDLFRRSPANDALDERPLAELAYTVFDTETTGLNPAQGDEIIAVGAVRIVNGRLLKGETFACLVDPRRSLSEASVAVHGITREALAGKPTLEVVLPRFRRFAEETVLVGHNAAFDMRFLQLAEARTGVRFDQPVLDTLLLSAIVHPAQDTHTLEEIAARLGVEVVDRHTALGDALVTANVFIKLLPLLAERGIRTLGEARAASERTYYARLQY